ncbi:MAG TPA: radical SAM protein, partial [Thermodesulfobacteriota bacterium]|nr:radical SAM protein [Thermodesulfobacteriota bacterium]
MFPRIQSPGLSLVFSAEEIETARKEKKLLSLDIELTKFCNLRCLYCYAVSGEKQKNELSFEELKCAIDEARGLGLRTLTLTGGEPLLDEKYFAIASYAHECGLSVLLFTNGILITKKIARKLLELKVSPCIKLDALSSATQDKLAGVTGALKKIKAGINHLISAGYTTTYPVLSVNATVCREN